MSSGSGRLRISAATTCARLHVILHLPKFLTGHPDLKADVILDDRVLDLVSEGIDLSLCMASWPIQRLWLAGSPLAGRSVMTPPAYLARAGQRDMT